MRKRILIFIKQRSRAFHRVGLITIFVIFPAGFFLSSANPGNPFKAQLLPGVNIEDSGSASISVPLELPPATSGMGPGLALSYSSGSIENGILGPGWDISGLGTISRDSSHGIFYSGSDAYTSSLGGRMVMISQNQYKNRLDGNIFYTANGVCGDGPCSWTANLDGKKYSFGTTLDSVVHGHTTHAASVQIWQLNRVEDTRGNFWTVSYMNDQGTIYPAEIDFTQNPSVGLTLRSVIFNYEDRPDVRTSFTGGVKTVLAKRLQSIVIKYGGSEVHRYEFNYTQSPLTLMSLMTRIHEFVSGSEIRSPLNFTYANESVSYSTRSTNPIDMGLGPVDSFVCWAGENACEFYFTNPALIDVCVIYVSTGTQRRCQVGNTWNLGDVNGDGKMDFVRNFGTSGALGNFIDADKISTTFLNESNPTGWEGDFNPSQPFGDAGSQAFVDVDGDSRTDYVRTLNGSLLVSLSNGSGFGAYQIWTPPQGTGNGSFSRWTDVNLDGKADFVRLINNNTLAVVLSTGGGFGSDFVTSGVDSGVVGADAFRQLADFDGDGIVDFCEILADNNLRVFRGISSGGFVFFGDFDTRIRGGSSFRILADVNGDGFTDFTRVDESNGDLVVSLGTGHSFNNPLRMTVSTLGDTRKRILADVNGDGMLDFVRFVSAGPGVFEARVSLFRNTFFYGSSDGGSELDEFTLPGMWDDNALSSSLLTMDDTNGDGRADLIGPSVGAVVVYSLPPSSPGLITQISDGNGKTISLTYAALTDTNGTNPSISQNFGNISVLADTEPDFVVQSVRLTGQSGIKGETTYQYSDARIKIGPTRDDSRTIGFQKITIRSSSGPTLQANPTYVVKNFWQNHPTLGYDGSGLLREADVLKTSDNSLVSQSIPTYARPASYSHNQLIKISEIATETHDFSTNPSTATRQTFTSFDMYGTPLRIMNEGDLASPGDDSITTISMSYPPDFPGGRIDSQTVSGNGQSYTSFTYNSSGDVTEVDHGLTQSTAIATTIQYNAVGNPIAKTRFGKTTGITYDDEIQQFPLSITERGSTITQEFDRQTGRQLWTRDPSGTYNVQSYDGYGRPTKSTRGSSTIGLLNQTLQEITYTSQSDGGMIISKELAFDGNNTRIESTRIDEWGQEMYEEGQGAIGMIRRDCSYDIFGNKISKTLPYLAGGSPAGIVTYQNDFLGRVTRIDSPSVTGTLSIIIDPTTLEVANFTSEAGVTLTGYAVGENRPNGQLVYNYKTLDGRTIQSEFQTSFSTASSPTTVQNGWSRTRYHYNSIGQIVSVTRGVGVSRSGISDNPTLTMRVSFDGFGRRTAIYDPDKGRTSFTYNPSGQLECETPPDGTTTCKTYDSLGRLQNVRRASTGGIVIASYIYDEAESAFGAGRLTSVQDESGTKRFHYDSMTGLVNRVERTYISGGKIKKFDVAQTYAPSGLLLSRSYPATNIQIIYDYYPEGVLKDIKLHDPDGHIVNSGNGSILAEYQPPNEMGKVSSVTYGNGVRINYEYSNATGSLTRMHASNTQGDIADYAYSTNNEGLLTGVQDNEQASGVDLSETYQYDIARRLISANGPYGPDKQHPHITLNYAYGEDGQPRMMNNQLVAYGSGNPHRITDTANLTYTYDVSSGLGSGDVALRRDVNGSTQNFTYTYHNRLKSVHTYAQDGVSDTTFLYDIEGNRFEKKFDANGIDIITHYPAPDYQIRVDGGEEVHTILISKIDGALATFTFNAIYEIAMVPSTPDYYRDRMLAGFQRFPEVFGQNGIHRLTGIFTMIGGSLIDSIRYDQRIGTKIIRVGSSVFVLLVLLLLLLLWQGNPEKRSFAYFPNIFQRLTALTTLIVFYGTIGCVGVEIPPGMVPVDGTLNPDVSGLIGNFYFITNQVHSNHLVTDANGKLICRYVYRPFGGLNMNLTDMDVDGDGVQFLGLQKFTGQEFDYETGLYNYKARIYDQETGMFLQPDPRHTENIGFDNYDRYAYVNNNPINFTDPSGESWLSVAAKHIGGAGFWGKLVPRGTHISFHLNRS